MAIAEFMAHGGKVLKGPDPIRVTGPEVLDYLKSCGISVGFAKSNSPGQYLYNGRHITLRKLVKVANKHRLDRSFRHLQARFSPLARAFGARIGNGPFGGTGSMQPFTYSGGTPFRCKKPRSGSGETRVRGSVSADCR
jgi:hypothetical protein